METAMTRFNPDQLHGMNSIHLGCLYMLTLTAHLGEWDEFTALCKDLPLSAVTLYNLADQEWGPYDRRVIHPMGNMLPITINRQAAHGIKTHIEAALPELAATIRPNWKTQP